MNRVKSVWRILKKIAFWVFFISLFLVTVTTVILHIYEDDIKEYAISELNSHLKTDVQVRNMEVSIFHDFPNASIAFENVFIADAYEEVTSDDTLLFAREMYFHFNLWDIWSGDYKVKRASIHQGQINLKTTKSGDINYGIIKPVEDSIPKESNFSFLLDLLKVEDVDFVFMNRSTNQDYRLKIHEAFIRGDFAETNYQLNAEGDLLVEKLKSGSLTLISNKEANLNLALDINTLDKSYRFKKGDLGVEDMAFDITGIIDSSQIDLDVIGSQIQVSELVNSIIPEESEHAGKYQGEGLVNFNGKISGPLSRTKMPSIVADFSVDQGALLEAEHKLKIHSINVLGNYQNAFEDRKEVLDFKTFSFKLLNSHLTGTGTMEDFSQPKLTTQAVGDLDLAAFHRFFGFKNVEELAGNVKLDLSCVILFFDPEYRKDLFEIQSSNGNIALSNVVYKAEGDALRYTNISGDILVQGKDAAAKNLSIKTQNSDLILNGALKNFVPFVEGSGSLGLIASLESSNFDLNEFLGTANKDKEGPLTMFELPGDINVNIQMNIDRFLWDNHTFEAITGQFLLANRKVTVNQMRLSTLGGNVKGKLILENRLENGNIIDGQIAFNSINAKNLFKEWDNFQQKSITDEHISGTISGNIDLLLLFNPYFSLVEEQILAVSDLTIINGELNDLETMKSITDYMRSNNVLKMMLNKHIDRFEEKLMHLKFSEMKNTIEIKDRRITIPKMTIKSNALDVDLFGWHDFDNNIEYHFSFRFRQLKTKAEYTEFGKVEDDGLGIIIYMTMGGTIDEPTFSLDSDERKNDIKENIQLEKTNMKSMLKTEFGLFQKDSTVQKVAEDNKNEVEFIFYETDIETEEIDTTSKKKNKKRVGKFFDKLKEEAEKDKDKVEYEQDIQ
ncbi:MAG: hypothetical protein GQ574_27605 [Crocinitomix sp.]|nr:hypothetical protein [Crocinitomix sp.]